MILNRVVYKILNQFRGCKVYFEPVGGNHGDTLIELGTRHIFNKYNIETTLDPKQAEAIIINGSGSVGVELWSKNLGGLKHYAKKFNNLPLIMLPSSFYFQNCYFPDIFDTRTAPSFIFTREKYSYELIKYYDYSTDVSIHIGHDMAFELINTNFFRGLKSRCSNRHILIVERFDREAVTGSPRNIPISNRLKKHIPDSIKHSLKKIIHHQRTSTTNYKNLALNRLFELSKQWNNLPVVEEDISSPVGFTFDQIIDAIVNSAVVVTTRLHVAILAVLLDKPTFIQIKPSPYPKLKACYDHSLSHFNHVHLWD